MDQFVLVEATQTFSGHAKPLYYQENKERFAKWNHKILHYVIDEIPEKYIEMARNSTNTGAGEKHWILEFAQKEMIKEALVHLKDDDMCYVSDVDEVWNPAITFLSDDVFKPMQDWCYIYYLNQRTIEDWNYFTGTIATKYKNIKNECLNHLRTHSRNKYTMIPKGGWHFNSLGGAEKKIEAFKHPVYTAEYMKTRELDTYIDEKDLPKYLLENKDKYSELFI